MANVADTYMIYQVLKRLTTPFNETKAFELGLIDKDGKLLKKAKTKDEENESSKAESDSNEAES